MLYPLKYIIIIQINFITISTWALLLGVLLVPSLSPLLFIDVSAKDAILGIFASTVITNNVIAIVKKEKLKDVAAGATWMVKNHLDNKHNTKSPDVILKEAELLVGQKMPYNLLTNNCEHFVTNLRYDKPESRQVRTN